MQSKVLRKGRGATASVCYEDDDDESEERNRNKRMEKKIDLQETKVI